MKIKFIYPKFEKFLETYPQLAEFPEIVQLVIIGEEELL